MKDKQQKSAAARSSRAWRLRSVLKRGGTLTPEERAYLDEHERSKGSRRKPVIDAASTERPGAPADATAPSSRAVHETTPIEPIAAADAPPPGPPPDAPAPEGPPPPPSEDKLAAARLTGQMVALVCAWGWRAGLEAHPELVPAELRGKQEQVLGAAQAFVAEAATRLALKYGVDAGGFEDELVLLAGVGVGVVGVRARYFPSKESAPPPNADELAAAPAQPAAIAPAAPKASAEPDELPKEMRGYFR